MAQFLSLFHFKLNLGGFSMAWALLFVTWIRTTLFNIVVFNACEFVRDFKTGRKELTCLI